MEDDDTSTRRTLSSWVKSLMVGFWELGTSQNHFGKRKLQLIKCIDKVVLPNLWGIFLMMIDLGVSSLVWVMPFLSR